MIILLGGDGYFGRNFYEYISATNKCVVVDKNTNTYYPNNIYFQHDLNKPFEEDLKADIVINFAAISFVDYSIIHPEETYTNNFNCCMNGLKLAHRIGAKYIYISTDEVNVNKDEKSLSPYVISKRLCEEYLSDKECQIIRPVNLMGICEAKKGLRQKQKCLLNNIVDAIINKQKVYIHGNGEQKRMFMGMRPACHLLRDIVNGNYKEKIIDVVKMPNYRTKDLKIRDIVYYLQNVYKYEIEFIEDPRGVYQDKTYNEINKTGITDWHFLLDCVEMVRKIAVD